MPIGNLAFTAYEAAWSLALPILPLVSGRLREGYDERVLRTFPRGKTDVWIQAASGGEAYLAREIIHALDLPGVRVLATTCTSQGLAVLRQAAGEAESSGKNIAVTPAFLPFDKPSLMRRALRAASPRLLVLLETELWPGLLKACRDEGIPAVIVNGRMTSRGLARYLCMAKLWRMLAPECVLAISGQDAARFRLLLGSPRVETMDNIKFDRLDVPDDAGHAGSPLDCIVGPESALAVFGSVRQEEEDEVLEAIEALRALRPGTVIGLFPRHMHRVAIWKAKLAAAGLPFVLRSGAGAPVAGGTVILWDTFGELGHAYGTAEAVFVGGSLRPLGGQNFLEPLAAGVIPVIGPYWSNFAWVGKDIEEQGLVKVATGGAEVAEKMADALRASASRADTKAKARAYFDKRRGGTLKACQVIKEYLQRRGP